MFRMLKEKKEKGFTLIELLIVMALLGVLVAVMLPKYQDLTPEAKLVASQQNLQTIRSAILIYAAKNQATGGMPDSLGDLIDYFPRRKVPVEKISGVNTSIEDAQADDNNVSCTNAGGWIYNPTTGTVFVNVNDITTHIANYTGSTNPFAEW
jgi:prepilin-type N-terminal cleavage/methylation domain-containing protein